MNVFKVSRISLLLVAFTVIVGCKVQVVSPTGGKITWSNGGNCAAGLICDIEITDSAYSETFTAVPAPGYEFVQWQDGVGFNCPGKTTPTCTVSIGTGQEEYVNYYASTSVMPIYRDVGIDSDGDGEPDRTDEDDDNDNILDVDDQCPGTEEGAVVDEFGCSEAQAEPADLCTGQLPADVTCGYEISEADWISLATETVRITIPKGKTLASRFKTSDSTTSHGRFQYQTPPSTPAATVITWVSLTPGGVELSAACSRGPAVKTYSFTWTQFDNRYCDLLPSQVYYLNIRHTDVNNPASSINRDIVTSSP